jgi:predicted nuclease of predicted toxin-antitoxin system
VAIRFHLDEHISAAVAAGLRRRNIDVTTCADAGLVGATDMAHIEFAAASGRVLVTQDDDFLRLHLQGVAHAGIAYCQQQSVSIGEMLRRVVLIHDLLSPEEMAGRVEYL